MNAIKQAIEEPSDAATKLAELILSDCGHSTAITTALRDRVALRIDKYTDAIAALRSMPEPYAYAVYFPDQPTEELVHDLDELLDDMTNREHTITPLFATPHTAPKVASSNLPVVSTAVLSDACEWSLEDEDNGIWQSSCGELWSFIDGGPKENRVSFCHHCGKPAVVRTAAALAGEAKP